MLAEAYACVHQANHLPLAKHGIRSVHLLGQSSHEGVAREQLQTLVDAAHIVCPYSNATRGNIDVTLVIAD